MITLFLAMPQNTTLVSSSSQSTSPNTLFYQHSPEPQQHQHAHQVKYPENGHDTLSDFVTFVCQETDNTSQTSQVPAFNILYPKQSSLLVLLSLVSDAIKYVTKPQTVLFHDNASAPAAASNGATRGHYSFHQRCKHVRHQLAAREHNATGQRSVAGRRST